MTGPADRETRGDVEAIQRVRDAHVAALNAGDADRWASLFTDDGVQMPPTASVNVGGERIRAWSRAFLAAFWNTDLPPPGLRS